LGALGGVELDCLRLLASSTSISYRYSTNTDAANVVREQIASAAAIENRPHRQARDRQHAMPIEAHEPLVVPFEVHAEVKAACGISQKMSADGRETDHASSRQFDKRTD